MKHLTIEQIIMLFLFFQLVFFLLILYHRFSIEDSLKDVPIFKKKIDAPKASSWEEDLKRILNQQASAYDILQVSSESTHREIKRAARVLAQRFHPDHQKHSGISLEQLQQATQRILWAKEQLLKK